VLTEYEAGPNTGSGAPVAILRTGFQIIPISSSRVVLRHRSTTQSFLIEHASLPVLRICEALKQGVNSDSLVEQVAHGDPSLSAAIRAIVSRLENLAALRHVRRPDDVDPAVAKRFERMLSHFSERETAETSRYDYLRRLRDSHVVLIGVGGLGSWTLVHLVASGVGHVTAVDLDEIESSNLARQALYRESDVGRSKVDAAAEAVGRLSSLTSFEPIHQAITSAKDIIHIVADRPRTDLVILTADTPLWQIGCWASEAALATGVPLLRGNSNGIGPFMKPGVTACPACAWPQLVDRIPEAEKLVEYYRHSRATLAGVGAQSTTLAIAGSVLAAEALTYLTGGVVRTYNHQIRVGHHAIEEVPFPRDSRCSICSKA
jgi:molybdopterin/thiamine biosynthesis adenylyltransferase